jgi:hypothetical protein
MTIEKDFKTINQVEKFLDNLYKLYDIVRVTGWPEHTEAGTYTFEVSGNDGTKVTIN